MPSSSTLTKAVILVGGHGVRLQPLSYHMPKPMMPVLNRPFLEHIIAYLAKFAVTDITLALSHLPELIRSHLGDGSNLGVQLHYTVEDSPLGTAGAVKNANRYLDSTFAVLNGDIFTDLNIADMLAFHQHKKAKVTIALTWVDNPCAFGVVETDSEDRVRRFTEKPNPNKATTHWINAGIYILEPEILRHIPVSSYYMFERGLFPLLLKLNEPVYGYPFRGYWLDMGTPEKYLCLNCDLLLAKMSSPLTPGLGQNSVCCEKDATVHPSAKIMGPAVIGSRCQIDQRARIEGPVIIGEDCHVGEDTSIEKAILWQGISIGAGASLKGCIIGSNTRIEEGKQITNRIVTLDRTGLPGESCLRADEAG